MQRLLALVHRVRKSPALVYLVATLLSRLGGFLLLPLYTRKLTEAEYGDYSLAQTMISLLPVLFTLGLTSAIPRVFFTERDEARAEHLVGGVARVCVAMTVVACALYGVVMALVPRAGPLSTWQNLCILVAVLGTGVNSILDGYLRTRQRPRQAAAFQLTQFALSFVTGVVMVRALGRGLNGAVEALALANGGASVIAGVYISRALPGRPERENIKSALRFSTPLVPHFMAGWLQGALDRWVLKGYKLTTQLGNYALASMLLAPVAMAVSAWNDAESAWLGARYREGGARAMLAARKRLFLGYLSVAAAFGLAVLVARPLVPLILGRTRFAHALDLLPLLVATTAIEALYYPSSNILYYLGHTGVIPVVTFSTALVNVLLNVLLIPRFGLDGALAARTVGVTLRTLVIGVTGHVLLKRAVRGAPEGEAAPVITP